MNNAKKVQLRRYFFDTEFNDTVGNFRIDFISIGVVDERGRDFYGISSEFNRAAANASPWLKTNVIDKLDPSFEMTIAEIRQGILDLIEPAHEVEFWAKNGSYDNVLLCQIFGGMGPLRETLKREKGIQKVIFRDTNELLRIAVKPDIKPMDETIKHIAINDARNERYVFGQCYKAIAAQNRPQPDVL